MPKALRTMLHWLKCLNIIFLQSTIKFYVTVHCLQSSEGDVSPTSAEAASMGLSFNSVKYFGIGECLPLCKWVFLSVIFFPKNVSEINYCIYMLSDKSEFKYIFQVLQVNHFAWSYCKKKLYINNVSQIWKLNSICLALLYKRRKIFWINYQYYH